MLSCAGSRLIRRRAVEPTQLHWLAPRRAASGGYSKVLVVVKHTPYEAYSQLKLQGKAPKALRWERLRDRHESHHRCVEELCEIVRREVNSVTVVSREDLARQHIEDVDLLIAVGGDGTVLSSAQYIESQTRNGPYGVLSEQRAPVLLGVNSDPTKPHERLVPKTCSKTSDERRSYGALCYAGANDMAQLLPRVLRGEANDSIETRHRMAVTIRGTLAETRLPPALNDVLIAHPSPAAVSRFRFERTAFAQPQNPDFSLNVWSSGIWVATATGATAAILSAGGNTRVDVRSDTLQYLVREHLIGENDDVTFSKAMSHGVVDSEHQLVLRWNSQHGAVYVDGHHTHFPIELGDEIIISSRAAPIRIFQTKNSSEHETTRASPTL